MEGFARKEMQIESPTIGTLFVEYINVDDGHSTRTFLKHDKSYIFRITMFTGSIIMDWVAAVKTACHSTSL